MPPRTSTNKITKAYKENIEALPTKKITGKNSNRATKQKRKPLADKTNSASDDNEHIIPEDTMSRPRRDRRLPSRFIDNNLIVNLSTSFSHSTPVKLVHKNNVTHEENVNVKTTKQKNLRGNSDKNNNPGKEKGVQVKKITKNDSVTFVSKTRTKCTRAALSKNNANIVLEVMETEVNVIISPETKNKVDSLIKPGARTNFKNKLRSNIKTDKTNSKLNLPAQADNISPNSKSSDNDVFSQSNTKETNTPVSRVSSKLKRSAPIPNYNKDFSCRIMEDKESPKKVEEKLAVYDFTFDPSEEPPPQKKKKKVVRKKAQPKPKKIYPNYYEHNVLNKLEKLKAVVKEKAGNKDNPISINNELMEVHNPLEVSNQRIEPVNYSEINYSPCTSITGANTKNKPPVHNVTNQRHKSLSNATPINKNLVNIQDEISFFEDQPIANSSMNESVRNPNASPWRVDFTKLPIKWGVNTYVKPNMTPAVESSYINPIDTDKKHVYTNILFNDLDKIDTSDNPKLKQTTITSFMKGSDSKVGQSKNILTPTKDNSIFNDSRNNSLNLETQAKDVCVPELNIIPEKEDNNVNKSKSPLKSANEEVQSEVPIKTKVVATADNFFGFDESSINDQENVSPVKNCGKIRRRKTRAKVLREKNQHAGPMRAELPRFVRDKTKEVVQNGLLPTVEEAEVIQKEAEQPVYMSSSDYDSDSDCVEAEKNNKNTNDKEGSPTVGLFEDIEIVHHNKPVRKSYGNTKMVTFRQTAVESEVLEHDTTNESDQLDDSSFHIPVVKVRKPATKKKTGPKLSKKEMKEADEWAAGFNSMCEDVDKFDLVVE